MKVFIKKTSEDAVTPSYATEGSACFDISAIRTDRYNIVNQTMVFGTGLSFQIPEDHVMLIFSRSGEGFKDDIRLSNCVGVIDSDYRGELLIKQKCDGLGGPPNVIDGPRRVAQGMILPVTQVEFVEGELSKTHRGDSGFGSTGV